MPKQAEPTRIIVKRKVAHAAHHGGAWKVAYADFVTAMMALFMVLWLLTQADVKLRSQIAQYFRIIDSRRA
jgi:chemotaxis protein MotB